MKSTEKFTPKLLDEIMEVLPKSNTKTVQMPKTIFKKALAE